MLAPDQPRSESERKSYMKAKRTSKVTKSSQSATGDSPTYPASTKDGRPTGDSNLTK